MNDYTKLIYLFILFYFLFNESSMAIIYASV